MDFLREIIEDLKYRFENKCTVDDFQLKRQLKVLNQFEKQLIRKKILRKIKKMQKFAKTSINFSIELEYNIGSLKVFKILKECKILTLTDYLLGQTNEEDLQGIIADVIDLDTSQQLLKEVIMSSKSSDVINTQFNQCFIQYTFDVMNRPELIKNEFVTSVEPLLTAEDFWELIGARFLNEILAQDELRYSELTQVLSDQKAWNLLYEGQKLKATCSILQKISKNHSEDIFKLVLKQLQSEEKINWFHLLLICRHAGQNLIATNDVKCENN